MTDSEPTEGSTERVAPEREIRSTLRTRCVVVGSGPGGAVLALILARKGIDVTLLEEHHDFERDFRGDTVHPATMEIMDQLGLADRLLELPHTKLRKLSVMTGAESPGFADFHYLHTRFPYITLMPQARFLEFITAEARRYPGFHLVMGANVRELIERDGVVRGVRYQSRDGWHEVRSLLTVGADGRFSRVRRLAGIEPVKNAPPMDVLWFRLPRRPGEDEGISGRFGKGHLVVMLDRGDEWQIAYVIAKGSYQELRAAGIEALRRSLVETVPELADRVGQLEDWKQVSLLSVESSRVEQWYRPGLLLIGDAAHVMSPAGGVGINYAIQDAVVAANVLTAPLRAGRMRLRDLAEVQRQRELPTRVIQWVQGVIQNYVVSRALDATEPFEPPLPMRLVLGLPFLRWIPPYIIGFGIRRARLEE